MSPCPITVATVFYAIKTESSNNANAITTIDNNNLRSLYIYKDKDNVNKDKVDDFDIEPYIDLRDIITTTNT